MIKSRTKASQGSALITALFMMTLVAIVAMAMLSRLQSDNYRTHLIIQSDKHYLAAEAVTFWAMSALDNKQKRTVHAHGKILSLPQSLTAMYPDIELSGELYDLQGRFNLNNLINRSYGPVFLNLLAQLLPSIPMKERSAIAEATRLWIFPFTPGRGQDELDNYYLQQKPPYYPGQQLFQSVSEFRLVRGVSAKIYQRLQPYITALPEQTPINLNTVSKPLLLALNPHLSKELVNELLRLRKERGGFSQKIFPLLVKKYKLRGDELTLSSSYFKCIGQASTPELTLTNTSILKRTVDQEKHIGVSLIEERLNAGD